MEHAPQKSVESDHPRGFGGRFATKGYADSGQLADLRWTPDHTFAYPQANDLDKVACVVDAVEQGADTPAAIAEALGVVDREGSYFADAAGWLGLVTKNNDDGFGVYELSDAGEVFASGDEHERSVMLVGMLSRCDDIALVRENPGALQDRLSVKYADSTAARRTSTMKAWASFIDDESRLGEQIGQMGMSAAMRMQQAVSTAKTERARRRPATDPAFGSQCRSCFQTMGLAEDECSNCGTPRGHA